MPQTAPFFDVIVLGMGAMGVSATYQLAKRGVRVLAIDQYDPPHRLGSSHGETRMTRIACGEGSIYTRLAQRSHEIWRQIEGELGPGAEGSLLVQNGMILVAAADAAGHGQKGFLNSTVFAALEAEIPFEVLDAAEIRNRHPFFAAQGSERAYVDRFGGFVRPEACVAAQLGLARKHGATMHVGETVLSFEQVGGEVRVTTDKGSYAAGHLIIAAGAWMPTVLGSEYRSAFKVTRQVMFWFAPEPGADLEKFRADRFPVFVWLFSPTEGVYGFPALGTAQDGIKIATEYDLETTPDDVDWSVSEREKQEMYERFIRPRLRGISNRCVRAEVCLYTVFAEDQGFLIDRHPAMDRVLVASACSGHGFKHSPAIGELLAKMALDEAHEDIGMLGFAGRGSS